MYPAWSWSAAAQRRWRRRGIRCSVGTLYDALADGLSDALGCVIPQAVAPAAVTETHSGIVFFVGDRAYKSKKAVDLGFLDFTTLASRREACHREVELNRRLAPDVYLGVADVLSPIGTVCEHLVVMRRMPDDRRLSALAAGGAALDEEVAIVARMMATFHESMPTLPVAQRAATVTAVQGRWDQLVDALSGQEFDGDDTRAMMERVAELSRRYLAGRAPLFTERIDAGRARDGHGDLLADDIFLLEDGPRILDCLDFDENLRCGDVLADVAFLAMDLEHLGRDDLAQEFLSAYRDQTGDRWPSSLAHHYVAQRALVRSSVSFIRGRQGDPAAASIASSLLGLSLLHLEKGRVRLVVVAGLPGTGKSTVAAGVALELGAVLLRTDELRKTLVQGDNDGRYEPSATEHTYKELLGRARELLERGESVVLDATWRSETHRVEVVSLARVLTADLTIVQCVIPDATADARIEARHRGGTDPSDATTEVAATMRRSWRPWPAAQVVETNEGPETSIAAALRIIRTDEQSERS